MDDGRAFRVMLRMRIREGMERDFERVWYEVGAAVTGHPANRGQWLSRGIDEDGVYYIVSDWVDEPRFREFERSEQHRRHREALHPYRVDGSMVTMEVVYDMPAGVRS